MSKVSKEPRKCAYCNKEFIPNSNHQIYCKGPHYMTCPVCGKEYEVKNNDKLKFPPTACSYECRGKVTLKRHGRLDPGNTPKAREKACGTMMKNLGVPYALMSEEVREKSKKTLIERYGVDNASKNKDIKEKRKKTVLEKYDGVYPFNSKECRQKQLETIKERYGYDTIWAVPAIQEKCRQTRKNRYGYEIPCQCEEFKQKRKDTLIDRYGTTSILSIPEFKDKFEQTCLDKYGVTNPAKSPDFQDKCTKTRIKHFGSYYSDQTRERYEQTMMERYSVPYSCLLPEAQNKRTKSSINYKFLQYLIDKGIPISENDMEFHIGKRSYDFIIPDTNILLELNPTYTHNSLWNHFTGHGISTDYHHMKTKLAEDNGYRCIHIWDWDDWDNIIDMIIDSTNSNKIYARKCKILIMESDEQIKTASSFVKQNHMQHDARGSILYVGLIYDDQLVQVISMSRSRYDKHYDYEILRMCSKKGYHIIGGSSRLLTYVKNYLDTDSIISYCDAAKFTGTVYRKMGMIHIRDTAPNKIWSKRGRYITSNILKARGFDQLFGTDYGKGADNEKLMIDNGWLPVYDCGQHVFTVS